VLIYVVKSSNRTFLSPLFLRTAMKILLFDLWNGGHNHIYFERFCEALDGHSLYIVAPDPVLERLGNVEAVLISSGKTMRQAPPFGSDQKAFWNRPVDDEARLIEAVCAHIKPDRFVHMFADHLIPKWSSDLTTCATSFLLFFPFNHYPLYFKSDLSEEEIVRGLQFENATTLWRNLKSTKSVLTLDPFAAELWNQTRGVPVHWLPEPPVRPLKESRDRVIQNDIVFFGALAQRKGLSRLAQAVRQANLKINIVIAGWIEQPGYEDELMRDVEKMRSAGANVELQLNYHTETEILYLLATSKCAVIPYWRHFGMSRVLLEACSVGTPVVIHDFGLLAHLVRKYDVGRAVNCDIPHDFAGALLQVMDDSSNGKYAVYCRRFAELFTPDCFSAAVKTAIL